MKLRLNISPCPNDTFMFDALINGRIDTRGLELDVQYHDIEQLNGRAARREADISKISYAALPAVHDRYRLLDSGSALGRGNGPLLVSRGPVDLAGPLRIAVPGFQTTADLLMKKFFSDQKDRSEVVFSVIADAVRSGRFDAGVLIHEGRFTYREKGLSLVCDLGQLWESATGLPLPLGGIVAARELPGETAELFDNLLHESIKYALQNPEASRDYVRSYAREMDQEVINSHISLFVNEFSLSLGRQGREAVRELTGLTIDKNS